MDNGFNDRLQSISEREQSEVTKKFDTIKKLVSDLSETIGDIPNNSLRFKQECQILLIDLQRNILNKPKAFTTKDVQIGTERISDLVDTLNPNLKELFEVKLKNLFISGEDFTIDNGYIKKTRDGDEVGGIINILGVELSLDHKETREEGKHIFYDYIINEPGFRNMRVTISGDDYLNISGDDDAIFGHDTWYDLDDEE